MIGHLPMRNNGKNTQHITAILDQISTKQLHYVAKQN